MYYVVGSLSMEQRRLWWLVAGGPSTDTWERGYLLAIPSTRENHRFILVVICDKRRGCTVIGVIASLPSRGSYYPTRIWLKEANRWCRNQSVYGQLGVLASEFRMIPRTQPGKLAVFEAALQLPWPMTGHEENTTVHKAKEGRVSVTR